MARREDYDDRGCRGDEAKENRPGISEVARAEEEAI